MTKIIDDRESCNTLDKMLLLSDHEVGSMGKDESEYNHSNLFHNKIINDDYSYHTNHFAQTIQPQDISQSPDAYLNVRRGHSYQYDMRNSRNSLQQAATISIEQILQMQKESTRSNKQMTPEDLDISVNVDVNNHCEHCQCHIICELIEFISNQNQQQVSTNSNQEISPTSPCFLTNTTEITAPDIQKMHKDLEQYYNRQIQMDLQREAAAKEAKKKEKEQPQVQIQEKQDNKDIKDPLGNALLQASYMSFGKPLQIIKDLKNAQEKLEETGANKKSNIFTRENNETLLQLFKQSSSSYRTRTKSQTNIEVPLIEPHKQNSKSLSAINISQNSASNAGVTRKKSLKSFSSLNQSAPKKQKIHIENLSYKNYKPHICQSPICGKSKTNKYCPDIQSAKSIQTKFTIQSLQSKLKKQMQFQKVLKNCSLSQCSKKSNFSGQLDQEYKKVCQTDNMIDQNGKFDNLKNQNQLNKILILKKIILNKNKLKPQSLFNMDQQNQQTNQKSGSAFKMVRLIQGNQPRSQQMDVPMINDDSRSPINNQVSVVNNSDPVSPYSPMMLQNQNQTFSNVAKSVNNMKSKNNALVKLYSTSFGPDPNTNIININQNSQLSQAGPGMSPQSGQNLAFFGPLSSSAQKIQQQPQIEIDASTSPRFSLNQNIQQQRKSSINDNMSLMQINNFRMQQQLPKNTTDSFQNQDGIHSNKQDSFSFQNNISLQNSSAHQQSVQNINKQIISSNASLNLQMKQNLSAKFGGENQLDRSQQEKLKNSQDKPLDKAEHNQLAVGNDLMSNLKLGHLTFGQAKIDQLKTLGTEKQFSLLNNDNNGNQTKGDGSCTNKSKKSDVNMGGFSGYLLAMQKQQQSLRVATQAQSDPSNGISPSAILRYHNSKPHQCFLHSTDPQSKQMSNCAGTPCCLAKLRPSTNSLIKLGFNPNPGNATNTSSNGPLGMKMQDSMAEYKRNLQADLIQHEIFQNKRGLLYGIPRKGNASAYNTPREGKPFHEDCDELQNTQQQQSEIEEFENKGNSAFKPVTKKSNKAVLLFPNAAPTSNPQIRNLGGQNFNFYDTLTPRDLLQTPTPREQNPNDRYYQQTRTQQDTLRVPQVGAVPSSKPHQQAILPKLPLSNINQNQAGQFGLLGTRRNYQRVPTTEFQSQVNEGGPKNKSDYNNSARRPDEAYLARAREDFVPQAQAMNQSNSNFGKIRLNISLRQRPPRGIDLMDNSNELNEERSTGGRAQQAQENAASAFIVNNGGNVAAQVQGQGGQQRELIRGLGKANQWKVNESEGNNTPAAENAGITVLDNEVRPAQSATFSRTREPEPVHIDQLEPDQQQSSPHKYQQSGFPEAQIQRAQRMANDDQAASLQALCYKFDQRMNTAIHYKNQMEQQAKAANYINKRIEKQQFKSNNNEDQSVKSENSQIVNEKETNNKQNKLKSRKTRGLGRKTLEKQERLRQEMNQIVLRVKTPEDTIVCKCSKSQCLQMYCECFTAGVLCDERCQCRDCCNIEPTQDKVRKARVFIKARNAKAFKSKLIKKKADMEANDIQESEELEDQVQEEEEESVVHATGCKCSKSGCQKKYCECYQAGILCDPVKCKCVNCLNCVQTEQSQTAKQSLECKQIASNVEQPIQL